MKGLSFGEFYYGAKHIETLNDPDELLCIVDAQPPGSMRQAAINRLHGLERDTTRFIAALTDTERLKKINRTRSLGSLFLSVASGRLRVLSGVDIGGVVAAKLGAHDCVACGCVYIGLREFSCGFKVAA